MEWQPIETAPTQRTVLVWATFNEVYGYTDRRDGMIRASFDGKKWRPEEVTGQYWAGMTPHRWTPLPAPPVDIVAPER